MKWADWTKEDFEKEVERIFPELDRLLTGMNYRASKSKITSLRGEFGTTRMISGKGLDQFVLALNRDISLDHLSVSSADAILKEILGKSSAIARKKGKPLDIANRLTQRMSEIESTLGPVFDQMRFLIGQGSNYYRSAAYLALLAFPIRWEIQGDFIRQRLVDLSQKSLSRNQARRGKLIEEYLSIWGIADDGKSDSVHLRNAIAHGRFRIKKDMVYFQDVDEKGKTIFEDAKSIPQVLYEMNNIFEKKVVLLVLALTWLRFMSVVTRSPFYSD